MWLLLSCTRQGSAWVNSPMSYRDGTQGLHLHTLEFARWVLLTHGLCCNPAWRLPEDNMECRRTEGLNRPLEMLSGDLTTAVLGNQNYCLLREEEEKRLEKSRKYFDFEGTHQATENQCTNSQIGTCLILKPGVIRYLSNSWDSIANLIKSEFVIQHFMSQVTRRCGSRGCTPADSLDNLDLETQEEM